MLVLTMTPAHHNEIPPVLFNHFDYIPNLHLTQRMPIFIAIETSPSDERTSYGAGRALAASPAFKSFKTLGSIVTFLIVKSGWSL